jgi:DNA-binding MarR family transcriptional regulator
MVTKGRSASPEQKVHRGEDHGRHKLTNEQVIYIRQRYAQGGITQKTLADEFGVSKSAIGLIIINRNWKHLESD